MIKFNQFTAESVYMKPDIELLDACLGDALLQDSGISVDDLNDEIIEWD